jgi:hypothetical protein
MPEWSIKIIPVDPTKPAGSAQFVPQNAPGVSRWRPGTATSSPGTIRRTRRIGRGRPTLTTIRYR